MPNWATTNYIVRGSKEELQSLHEELIAMMKDSGIKNGFGSQWLGHIAYNLFLKSGYSKDEARNEVVCGNKVRCRGVVLDIELNDDELNFSTESAWNEPSGLFELLLSDTRFSGCKLYWFCCEPGVGYYGTNDIERVAFNGDYYIDHEGGIIGYELVGEDDLFSKDDAKEVFIRMLTSSYVNKENRLTKIEAEAMSVEELYHLVDSAEFFDEDGEEIFVSVNEVVFVD